jgi:hypothetical protein
MRSQSAILLVLPAGLACTRNAAAPVISQISTPVIASSEAPDLSLRKVAFARLSEGRLVARGTADHLDYRRAGGRLMATGGDITLIPDPGAGLAAFGTLHVSAPRLEGEIANRRGVGSGGVNLDTGRGDHAFSEAATYDGTTVRSESRVTGRGAGYHVESNGMVAATDGSSVRLTRGVKGTLDDSGAQR